MAIPKYDELTWPLLESLKDGHELWSYEVGQPLDSSPAVADGKIVIGSNDGSVYCFGATSNASKR